MPRGNQTRRMLVDEDEESKVVVSNDRKKGLQAFKYAFDKHTRLLFHDHLSPFSNRHGSDV